MNIRQIGDALKERSTMFASVLSAAILGMEVHPIHVEADVSDGLPSFTMVGFPSAQVKEAQDRVRTALKNNGIALPPKRIKTGVPMKPRFMGQATSLRPLLWRRFPSKGTV